MRNLILRSFKKSALFAVVTYGVVLSIWLLLIFWGELFGVGAFIGMLTVMLFWIYISPLKLIMQGLAIPPPAFFSNNLLSGESISVFAWLIIHLFNVSLLILLAFVLTMFAIHLKKPKKTSKIAP